MNNLPLFISKLRLRTPHSFRPLRSRQALLISLCTLFILGPTIFLLTRYARPTSAAWFDDAWLYRVRVPVTNNTTEETNVYLNFTGASALDTSDTTKFQADCGDLRFTDQYGNLLSYYLVSGCGTSSTVVHVLLPSFPAGAQSLYYYYGNSSAVNGFYSSDFSTEATSYTIGTLASEELSPAPALYWKLNEGTGITANNSGTLGSTGNGTITGSSWITAGQCIEDQCLSLNGTSDVVSVGNTISGLKTVSFWVKPATTSEPLLDLNGSAYIEVSSGTLTTTGFTTPTIYVNGKPADTLTAGVWQHVAVTTGTGLAGSAIKLGQISTNYGEAIFDEVRFYTYARSAEEIKTDYNGKGSHQGSAANLGSNPGSDTTFESNLVGYWKFNEGYEATANNSGTGGASLDGTITGPTWNSDGKFGKALHFNGSTHAVSVASIAGVQTVSFWVKPTSTTESLLDLDGSAYLTVSSGTISATGFTTPTIYVNGKPSTTLTADVWQHVAVTTATPITASAITLGRANSTSLAGLLDEVKIYSAVLAAAEIRLDMNQGSALVLGSLSNTSNLTGGGVASNSAAAAYCVPGSSNSCATPIAIWNFDHKTSSTTVYDQSGNGLDMTILNFNSKFWKPGKIGSAMQTTNNDGLTTRTYINDPASGILDFSNSQDYTISMWTRFIEAENNQQILYYKAGNGGTDTGYNMDIDSSGYYRCNYADSSVGGPDRATSTTSAYDNSWHYVSCIMDRDGSETGTAGLHIYVDGILENSDTSLTEGDASNAQQVILGETSTTYEYEGYIDEVKVYNYARTPAQVAWDYNRGKPIGHWKLDECQGTTAYDSSGNGNNGTINIGATGDNTTPGTCSSSGAWAAGNIGKYNHSLDFDGTNDFISLGDPTALRLGSTGAASAWIYPTSYPASGWKVVFNKGNWGGGRNYYSAYFTSTLFRVDIGGTSAYHVITTPKENVPLDTWTHIAMTWDGSYLRMYLNGKPVGNPVAQTQTPDTTGYNLEIGTAGSSTSYVFDGAIDDVRLYNYGLTLAQVKTIMNDGASLRFGPSTGTP